MPKLVDQDDFHARLGKRCRELREERGWTLTDMATHGLAPSHYQKIEKGKALTVWTAYRIARAFGVTLSDLFEGL